MGAPVQTAGEETTKQAKKENPLYKQGGRRLYKKYLKKRNNDNNQTL